MKGLARILRDGASAGAGFLTGTTRLTTCAHVVNIALVRDPYTTAVPDADAALELDFPNDLIGDGDEAQRERRVGRVIGWHPPTPEERDPGPTDDIAVLALDRPMPAESVPPLHPGPMPGLGARLSGWGTPRGADDGLWAPAILSGAQGILRQIDLKADRPELRREFSGGPVCDQDDGRILGMMAQIDEGQGAAWMLPLEALRRAWDALNVLRVQVEVRDGRLYAEPGGPAAGTDLPALLAEAGHGNGRVLLDALFGAKARDIAGPLGGIEPAAPGTADTDPRTGAPPRLRIRCADADCADLPWQIVTDPDGRRLGERGWVVEVTGTRPRPAVTREIDTPLILSPASNALVEGANVHVQQIAAALAPLLTHDRAKVSWAVDGLDLRDALEHDPPPDLVYCFARLRAGRQLLLGRDRSSREHLPLDDLLAGLAAHPPLLWLHLVSDEGVDPDRRRVLAATASFPLCVLQVTRGPIGKGLKRTLRALDALAECRTPAARSPDCTTTQAEPAAILSRIADPATRFRLGSDGLSLSPAPDSTEWDRERIRASLIQLLLGRTSEKDSLIGRIADPLHFQVRSDSTARDLRYDFDAVAYLRDAYVDRIPTRTDPRSAAAISSPASCGRPTTTLASASC